MISAAADLSTYSAIVISRPIRNTNVRRRRSGNEVDRDRVLGRRPPGDDEPAVDEADEQDEQADADADRPLERQRHGVHDRFAEADEDQQQ